MNHSPLSLTVILGVTLLMLGVFYAVATLMLAWKVNP